MKYRIFRGKSLWLLWGWNGQGMIDIGVFYTWESARMFVWKLL